MKPASCLEEDHSNGQEHLPVKIRAVFPRTQRGRGKWSPFTFVELKICSDALTAMHQDKKTLCSRTLQCCATARIFSDDNPGTLEVFSAPYLECRRLMEFQN